MTSTVFRTIGEGTFWISASTLAVKIVGLATVFLILSHLGVAEYGTLELVLSVTTLLSIFLLPGLDTMVAADMSVEKGKGELYKARSLLLAYTLLQGTLGFIAWALVFFASQMFADFYSVPKYYVQFISLLFLIGPIRASFLILFKVHLNFFLQSMVGLLEEVAKLGLIIGLFMLTEMDIGGVLLAMVFAQCISLVLLAPWFVFYLRALGGGGRAAFIPPWELLYDHGKWSVLTSYLGNFTRSMRIWIIQRMLGPEAVGIYAVASGLMGHTIALAPLHTTITPLLAQFSLDKDRFTRLLNKGIKYQLLAHVVLGVSAFFIFPPIIAWLFPDYSAALPLYQLMLLALLPGAITSTVTPAFAALKLQRSLFFSMMFKTILTIVITPVAVLMFGLWGVAVESIVTALAQSIERLLSLKRRVPGMQLSPSSIIRFDDDDRLILNRFKGFILRFPFLRNVLK